MISLSVNRYHGLISATDDGHCVHFTGSYSYHHHNAATAGTEIASSTAIAGTDIVIVTIDLSNLEQRIENEAGALECKCKN